MNEFCYVVEEEIHYNKEIKKRFVFSTLNESLAFSFSENCLSNIFSLKYRPKYIKTLIWKFILESKQEPIQFYKKEYLLCTNIKNEIFYADLDIRVERFSGFRSIETCEDIE